MVKYISSLTSKTNQNQNISIEPLFYLIRNDVQIKYA